jgi:hypothetical protein
MQRLVRAQQARHEEAANSPQPGTAPAEAPAARHMAPGPCAPVAAAAPLAAEGVERRPDRRSCRRPSGLRRDIGPRISSRPAGAALRLSDGLRVPA